MCVQVKPRECGEGGTVWANQVEQVSSGGSETCQNERANFFVNEQPREARLGLVGAEYHGDAFRLF